MFGPALEHALEQGWLRETRGVYGVAPGHFRDMPWIRSLFYSEGAVGWLESRGKTNRTLSLG